MSSTANESPQTIVDEEAIRALIQLSLRGLERMYAAEAEALYSVTFESGQRETVEHLGLRYTVMSSLGIHQAQRAGYSTSLDAGTLLKSGLERYPKDDIDHLAMAIWADATIDAGVAQDVIPRLLNALDKDLSGVYGRIVSWALTALSLQAERDDDPAVHKKAKQLRDFAITHCWNESGRLFNNFAGGNPFMRKQGLFSTQIYWVYALATYGRVFSDEEAIQVATKCADQLIVLRDEYAGWPWRYYAPGGFVTERYPVYAVHQDAMAPMTLNVLSAANQQDYQSVIQESFGWLWKNELNINMVDTDESVIFRAIRRTFPTNRLAYNTGWASAWMGFQSPFAMRPGFLRLNATCRPYHLGWLLHACAGYEDTFNRS